jgi:RNA polymerase sigma-70 factor (ECF subfamily)
MKMIIRLSWLRPVTRKIYEDRSDADLIALIAAKDMAAYDALVLRTGDFLYGVCRRVTARNEDAEDALQEALIGLWLKAGSFRGESAPIST